MENDFESWVHSVVFPLSALVIATDLARDCVLRCSGLSIPELLQPFGGHFTPLSAPCRALDRTAHVQGCQRLDYWNLDLALKMTQDETAL